MKGNHTFISAIMDNPSIAVKLIKAIGTIGGTPAFLDIEQSAHLRLHDRSIALRLLDNLCTEGILANKNGGWRSLVSPGELHRLLIMAEGAEAALICRKDRDKVKLVVTFPGDQGCFMESLRDTGPYYASIAITDEAFIQIATQAKTSLVIMTPFLDKEGMSIIRRMFAETLPQVKKTLLLRDIPSLMATGLGRDLAEMQSNGVDLVDYLKNNPNGPVRFETFHSKIILCDSNSAYIGSANFLASSLSRSFEVGVLIEGKTAEELARVINSILDKFAKLPAGC